MDTRVNFDMSMMPIPTPIPSAMYNLYNNNSRDPVGLYTLMGHQLPMPPVEWTPDVIERAHWRPHNSNVTNNSVNNSSNNHGRSRTSGHNNYNGNRTPQSSERQLQSLVSRNKENNSANISNSQGQEVEALEWTAECHPNHWTAAMKCSICLEFFSTPVVLPCGHSFCHGCVDELIQRVCRSCPVVENYPRLHFQCPNCRHGVSVSQFMNHAPINVALHSTIESWKASPDRTKLIAEKNEMSCQTENVNTKNSSIQTTPTKTNHLDVTCVDCGTQTPKLCTTKRNASAQTPTESQEGTTKPTVNLTGPQMKPANPPKFGNASLAHMIKVLDKYETQTSESDTIREFVEVMDLKHSESSHTKLSEHCKKSKKRLSFDVSTKECDDAKNSEDVSSGKSTAIHQAEPDSIAGSDISNEHVADTNWQCEMANKWLQWAEGSSNRQQLGLLVFGLYTLLSIAMLVADDIGQLSASAPMAWLQATGIVLVSTLFTGMIGVLHFANVPMQDVHTTLGKS